MSDPVRAAALLQEITPTSTPWKPSEYNGTPTWEPYFQTSTPGPTQNVNCNGVQPIGWGTVTPDARWVFQCSKCITQTPRATWEPTVTLHSYGYATSTSTPDGTEINVSGHSLGKCAGGVLVGRFEQGQKYTFHDTGTDGFSWLVMSVVSGPFTITKDSGDSRTCNSGVCDQENTLLVLDGQTVTVTAGSADVYWGGSCDPTPTPTAVPNYYLSSSVYTINHTQTVFTTQDWYDDIGSTMDMCGVTDKFVGFLTDVDYFVTIWRLRPYFIDQNNYNFEINGSPNADGQTKVKWVECNKNNDITAAIPLAGQYQYPGQCLDYLRDIGRVRIYTLGSVGNAPGRHVNSVWHPICYGGGWRPTPTVTPTVGAMTPTPSGSYCQNVVPKGTEVPVLPDPRVSPSTCVALGGFVINLAFLKSIFGFLPDAIVVDGYNFCVRAIMFGSLNILGIIINLDTLAEVLAGVAAIRLLWRM